jgi:hypothetical protein
MSEIVRIASVEPVLYGVVKIGWKDGYEAMVDLRPVIAEGDMFSFLRDTAERFRDVQIAEAGHAIFWLDDTGDEIGFSSNALRERAERQAEILRLAS